MKNTIKTSIRAIIGIGLAVFLIKQVLNYSGVDIAAEFEECQKEFLLFAFLGYGMVLLLCIYRWKLLLDVQGVKLTFFTLIRLSMIGIFFNLVVPGAVSGDLFKMYYISSHSSGKTTEAVLTIMLDRIIGLFGLFLVTSIAIFFSFDFLLNTSPEIRYSVYLIGSGSIAGVIGFILIYYRESLRSVPVLNRITILLKGILPEKVNEIVLKLVAALDLYRHNLRVIFYALLLSATVHLSLSFCVYSVGKGFHENVVGLKHYCLSTQIANAITAIPITPSGFGSRDFVLSYFLVEGGALKEKAGIIPPFFSIVIAVWSLVGGAFFIFHKRQAG